LRDNKGQDQGLDEDCKKSRTKSQLTFKTDKFAYLDRIIQTNQNIFPVRQEPTLTNILFSSQDLSLENLLSKTKSDNS
jgi:hypothetical protein